MSKVTCQKSPKGYIALTSILVISAVILTIGISVSLLSISEGQMSLAEKKKEETLDFVEGCLAEILLKLNEDNTVATEVTLPEGSCSVTINSHSGNDWDFTVSGSRDNYYQSIQIQAVWQSPQLGLDWLEVE